jgi:hypothetical protein
MAVLWARMPETSINEDCCVVILQENVRIAGQVRMHFVFYIITFQEIMGSFLRLRPLAPDA